jgi:hypothetical protein
MVIRSNAVNMFAGHPFLLTAAKMAENAEVVAPEEIEGSKW